MNEYESVKREASSGSGVGEEDWEEQSGKEI
jgi:hypothetical protein